MQMGAVSTRLGYDAFGEVARLEASVGDAVLLDRRLTRDGLGRLIGVVERTTPGRTTTAYAYDDADRLASVSVDGKVVESDAYDAAGNRVRATTAEGTVRGAYDARDRLTTWGSTTYAWNADDSLASMTGPKGTTTFHVDELGHLRDATMPDGRKIGYLVDADGRRIGRSVNGSLAAGYLYDPRGQPVAETDGSGAVGEQFAFDDLGHLAWVGKGDRTYRVITDQVGSPRLVVDVGNGKVVEAIDYDAWGRITRDTAPGFTPFGFAGGLRDPDTGFVHFGARDYDPVAGRWLAPDPIRFAGGDANLYRYASGDPVNLADPSGLCVPAGSSDDNSFGGPPCTNDPRPNPGSVPPLPPYQPPPPAHPAPNPPIFRCYAAICSGSPPNSPSQPPSCWFGDCGFGQDGNFSCNQVVFCSGPHGENCYLGSCSFGDTHIQTADASHLDFQAAGEFVAATTPDGQLQVQLRTQPVLGGTLITFNTAVAALVDGDRIGAYADEPAFLEVNGKPVAAADIEERLPRGGTLERHGGGVTLRWADGSILSVTRNGGTLDVSFEPSTAVRTGLRGLLGDANGDPADDLTGRDGIVLARDDPTYFTKLYSQFGESWRVTPSESLFDYGPGEGTAKFTDRNIPSAEVTVDSIPVDAKSMAQTVCQAAGVRAQPLLDDCLIDVGMTGDAAYAASTAAVAGSGMATANTTGPSPNQGEATPIQLGQAVSGTIAARADVADYSFGGTKGELVYLQAHGDCSGTLGWDLVGPNGAGVGGTPACHDLGRESLPSAGTWTVRINGDQSTTGTYAFSVLAVPATVVTPVTTGASMSGSLQAPGSRPSTPSTAPQATPCTSSTARPARRRSSGRSSHPAEGSEGATTSCQDLDRLDLTESGAYSVRFSGAGPATGPYAFALLAIPTPVVTPISAGQAVSGSITSAGQIADYTFAASAGQAVHPTAQGACVDGLGWKLLGPDGATIDFAVACHDLGPDTLSRAGTYTLRFDGDRATVGAFSFTLAVGN